MKDRYPWNLLMSRRPLRNVAASIRRRLLNLSRERNEEFQSVLIRYARERLLGRLSQSPHRDRFTLKGAVALLAWVPAPYRATKGLDLHCQGDPSADEMVRVFREVCEVESPEDGLEFKPDGVTATDIRDAQEYGGVRVKLMAELAGARVGVQVDIAFGDAIVPRPKRISLPTMLDLPRPTMKAYPPETIVAEKLHAMVVLGIANSRMKDFFDLWSLARALEFSGSSLSKAIAATFGRRDTPIPEGTPIALTGEFATDGEKQTQWKAFGNRGTVEGDLPGLSEVVSTMRDFLGPPLQALRQGRKFGKTWTSGGPWA